MIGKIALMMLVAVGMRCQNKLSPWCIERLAVVGIFFVLVIVKCDPDSPQRHKNAIFMT
jgi:uncharacterized membrane protein SirB2